MFFAGLTFASARVLWLLLGYSALVSALALYYGLQFHHLLDSRTRLSPCQSTHGRMLLLLFTGLWATYPSKSMKRFSLDTVGRMRARQDMPNRSCQTSRAATRQLEEAQTVKCWGGLRQLRYRAIAEHLESLRLIPCGCMFFLPAQKAAQHLPMQNQPHSLQFEPRVSRHNCSMGI